MNVVHVLVALFLVLLNGFFVAAEFSLARARLTRLDQLAQEGVGAAALAGRQARNMDKGYLAACQLGITIASLGLGWLGEPAFAHMVEPLFDRVGLRHASAVIGATIIGFAIITVLHVVVGELAPKTLALHTPEGTARFVSRPLESFRILFSPLIIAITKAGNSLIRSLGVRPATGSELASTAEDLQRLIAQSEQGGVLEPEEADMLEGVFALGDRTTRDVMTPRPEVVDLDADLDVRTALEEALATRHSRFPVSGGDEVLGVVHLSDLAMGMLKHGDATAVRAVTAPAYFVPETLPVDELLREMQRRRSSLAVVLDEYGELSGVVTVEDVLEEIVGEIDDERDRAPAVDLRPDGQIVVRGHVPLEDLDDHGVEVEDDSVTSVGGLIFSRLGRLPRTGDAVVVDGWRFTVEATRGTRVLQVAVDRAEGAADDPPSGDD